MCARSARRMLYVAAVGTLISTLNQAYKSSEVHVSMRMISEGRLLALTSSGIYIGALQLRRSSAAYRAVLSGAELAKIARLLVRIRAQYRHGRTVQPLCPSLVRLCEYLHKIYYPTAVKEPFRKLLCKHSNMRETIDSRGVSIPLLPPG